VTRLGLLFPGEMGAAVGAAADAEVLWASAGRSEATAKRAAGFHDMGTVAELVAASDIVLSICPPAIAEDAGRMSVVHHHDAIIFFSEVTKGRQVGDVAVHRKYAVGDEELLAVPVFSFLQNALAIGRVFMLEDLDRRLGQAAAVNDGGVVELVGDDQIILAKDCGNSSGIGGEARLKYDAGFHFLESRDLLLEIHVHLHRAGDRADRARAHSEFANRINGGAAQLRLRRETEIIIRAQIDDFLAVENGDWLSLKPPPACPLRPLWPEWLGASLANRYRDILIRMVAGF